MKAKLALIVVMLLPAGLLVAQGPAPQPAAGNRPDFAQRRIDFLSTALSLTDAQKQQATEFFNTARQENQPLEESMKQARTTLVEAAESGEEAQLDQAAAKVGTLCGQMAAVRAKAFAKLYSVLTPEQRQKADQLAKTLIEGEFGFHPHPAN
jgi:Spy/CpxP family protein refolding chaperone